MKTLFSVLLAFWGVNQSQCQSHPNPIPIPPHPILGGSPSHSRGSPSHSRGSPSHSRGSPPILGVPQGSPIPALQAAPPGIANSSLTGSLPRDRQFQPYRQPSQGSPIPATQAAPPGIAIPIPIPSHSHPIITHTRDTQSFIPALRAGGLANLSEDPEPHTLFFPGCEGLAGDG